jgi:hypothetical protein
MFVNPVNKGWDHVTRERYEAPAVTTFAAAGAYALALKEAGCARPMRDPWTNAF